MSAIHARTSSAPADSRQELGGAGVRVVKALVWIYFALLILEGPLRKWILPGLSNPLLLVRDPIAILLYVTGISMGVMRFNVITALLGVLGLLGFLAGMLVGTKNLYVTLYGFDASFFHLPLVFLIGRVLTRDDVLKIGRVIMFIAITMAPLMVAQFRASPHALVNAGPGGGTGSQMESVMGKIRPPGYFNFITGAAQFLSLSTAFIVFALLERGRKKLLVYPAALALIVSAVVSTSRLTLGGIGVVLLCIGVVALYNRTIVKGIVGMLLPVGVVFFVATSLDVFKEGTDVFEARLVNTGDANTDVVQTASNWSDRVLGDFIAGFKAMEKAPLFGHGIGYGTNVGSRLLTGKMLFLGDEREWGRVVFEMGPVLGLAYLALRVVMVIGLFREAAKSARAGNFLPMLLFGTCALALANGQLGVASTLGFAVFTGGLCLAANNVGGTEVKVEQEAPRSRGRRGASPYAQKWIRSSECSA